MLQDQVLDFAALVLKRDNRLTLFLPVTGRLSTLRFGGLPRDQGILLRSGRAGRLVAAQYWQVARGNGALDPLLIEPDFAALLG